MTGPRARPAGAPLGRKIAYALLLCVGALVGLEGLARLIPAPARAPLRGDGRLPGGAQADAELGWTLAPGARVEDRDRLAVEARCPDLPKGNPSADLINRWGMRDDPVPARAGPEELRILVLGDSSVYGAGVPRDHTFSELLQARLRAEGRPAQVFNAGVPGWSTYQSLGQLRRFAAEREPPLSPDVVVVYNMNSDLMTPLGALRDDQWFPASARLGGLRVLSGLALVQHGVALRARLRPPPPADPQGVRVLPEAYAANLGALADLAEDLGARPLFVLPPVLSDLGRDPGDPADPGGPADRMSVHRRQMAAVAMARGISWVDAPRAFFSGRASGDPLGCGSLMLDRVHPSVAGHTLLSDLLRVALAAPPGARVSSPD